MKKKRGEEKKKRKKKEEEEEERYGKYGTCMDAMLLCRTRMDFGLWYGFLWFSMDDRLFHF